MVTFLRSLSLETRQSEEFVVPIARPTLQFVQIGVNAVSVNIAAFKTRTFSRTPKFIWAGAAKLARPADPSDS